MELIEIGKIAQFINGMAFKPEDWSSNGVRIIRIQNLTDPSKEFNRTLKTVPEKYYIHKGDVLVSWSATIDVFVWEDSEEAVLNQHIFKVNFDSQKIYKYYFIYALKETIHDLSKLAHGSTMRHVVKSDFEAHKIPIPSYENQIRIANLLEKIEATITERKKAIDLLDELLQAKFNEMFYNEVFPIKTIEEVSLNIIDCPHSTPKYLDSISDYPCIRTSEIKNGRIDWSSMKYTDYDGYIQRIERLVPQEGDIIFAREGSVGDAAIIPKNVTLSLGQRVMMFRVNPDLAAPEYIWAFIKSNKTQHIIKSRLIGATVSRINISEVRKIQCPIPPLEIQNQFAEIVQQIEIIKTEQEAQLKDLEELYTSVSHQVFEGDIDLSKVPFDTSLLPNPIGVLKKESIEKPDVILHQEVPKEQIKKVIKPIKGKLKWENISFKEVADYIQYEFDGHYFNAEMLLRYLREDIGIFVNYFSSAEQKKNPQYENADDFYRFIATALTGENHFLQLEQIFYNAETENIPNISFTETDVENLSKKDKKERSGIYFRIKNETTTP